MPMHFVFDNESITLTAISVSGRVQCAHFVLDTMYFTLTVMVVSGQCAHFVLEQCLLHLVL